MSLADTIRATDLAIKAVSRPASRPMYWCQHCAIGLHQHEADHVRISDSYEFWGERGTYETLEVTCGACGHDVEDYAGQDEVEA